MPRLGSGRGPTTRRVPGHSVLIDHVQEFVDFVKILPKCSATGDEPGTKTAVHPAKRVKLDASADAIPIVRHRLSFTAETTSAADSTTSFRRNNVGKYLRVRAFPAKGPGSLDERGKNLIITQRHKDPDVPPFNLVHPLKWKDLPKTHQAALDVTDTQSFNPDSEGVLWACVDVEIHQDGCHVDIGLTTEIFWNEGLLGPESQFRWQRKLRQQVLESGIPGLPIQLGRLNEFPSAQDLYGSFHVPDKEKFDQQLLRARIPHLTANLYPFQRRSVQWLLNREGVKWTKDEDSDGSIVRPMQLNPPSAEPLSFVPAKDVRGETFWISPAFGAVTKKPSRFFDVRAVKGGILAEEMGLGKTLEIMSLVLLHRQPEEIPVVYDPYMGKTVRSSGATLIITPSPLLDQWLSELKRHAPQLKVLHYVGVKSLAKRFPDDAELIEELVRQDVVITTYDMLRTEFHAAMPPPNRSMRAERKYVRPICPLTQISWWRLCIDEAQMVENWTSNTAVLARLIPRVNAWAVTGTPLKDHVVRDLYGLLVFLRVEPFATSDELWSRLCWSDRQSFSKLMNLICLRHSKSAVRSEITLPPQQRYVMTVPLSAVEEQYYQNFFSRLTRECGLDTAGNPIVEDWSPEDPKVQQSMRLALDQLRHMALQPQLVQRGGRALGLRQGPMRTVAEVLDAMLEQSEAAIRNDQRGLLNLKLSRGQVLAGLERVQEATALWEEVLKSSTVTVAECRKHLEEERTQVNSSSQSASQNESEPDDEDNEEAVPARLTEAQRRLRSALEIQHKAAFFCANAYFTIKSDKDKTIPDSDDFKRLEGLETEMYELAKSIRKDILHGTSRKATRLMTKLATTAGRQEFTVIPELEPMFHKGIESRNIVDAFQDLCRVLDGQANQLDEWREHVIQLLLEPLLDEDSEDLTGEEYDESAKLQDEITVYVQILRFTIQDRQGILSGQNNFLVEHESRGAIRQAKDGEGPCPEKVLELSEIRHNLKRQAYHGDSIGSLRGIVAAVRAISIKLRHDAAAGSQRAATELAIITDQLKNTQSQLTEQEKAVAALEREIELFSELENTRLTFYRQLQAVSDSVADYRGDKTDHVLVSMLRQEDDAVHALATNESKHRYLVHLKEADAGTEEQRLCVICQSTFSIGVLTICGHQFCKECITLWFRAHRNCPVCKRHLNSSNLHDITLKPQELKAHVETIAGAPGAGQLHTSPAQKSAIYKEFSKEKLAEIQDINLDGLNFTTKVDTMIRHLLWLRQSDPGAKSIIFSQYKGFLRTLEAAFVHRRIGFASFEHTNGITHFKEDPSKEVFLLHARNHSSGLNLVNASHVFLCEPMVNTALELQAIARVHRIGQEHQTTVWLYVTDGTVEESIYNLSVQRRMEHMGHNLKGKSKESTPELLDANLEAANSLELQANSVHFGKDRRAGEEVDMKDLWTCLFGHVKAETQNEERLRNNPAVRGFLAAEAAEERRGNAENVNGN